MVALPFCLQDTDKMPHERFALPVTGNMTYGFFGTKTLVPPSRMFDYKSRQAEGAAVVEQCPVHANAHTTAPAVRPAVTIYAQNYVKSLGHSPFSHDGGAAK